MTRKYNPGASFGWRTKRSNAWRNARERATPLPNTHQSVEDMDNDHAEAREVAAEAGLYLPTQ